MELSSSVGSSKRVRSPGSMAHVVSCVVDGCNSDLSGCREYHRRHKVCELHSKTPKVTIKGRELRFCQQCSRFHSLMEFDEGKRSCRKRLDGHNRRRRKPRTETSIFHSSEKGSRYLSFKNLQIPPSAVVRSGNIKSQDHTKLFNSQSSDIDKHNPFTSSLAQSQFLCSTDHILPEAFSGGQLLLYPNSASKNYGKSDGALSLLSSAALTETRVNIGSSHMVHPAGPIPMSQSLLQNQHFSGLGQFPFITRGMITNPVVSDQDQTNITALHFQGARQNRFDGSSGSDASQQKLWFGWI